MELTELHWDENIKNKLIGRRAKYYMTIRLLVGRIVDLQDSLYRLNRRLEICKQTMNTNKYEDCIEFEYKNERNILEYKLEEAYLDFDKFRKVSLEIPNWGGQVACVLDYIMHGMKWIMFEIRSRTIYERMSEQNAIAYIKEAEKLFGRKFNI